MRDVKETVTLDSSTYGLEGTLRIITPCQERRYRFKRHSYSVSGHFRVRWRLRFEPKFQLEHVVTRRNMLFDKPNECFEATFFVHLAWVDSDSSSAPQVVDRQAQMQHKIHQIQGNYICKF